MESININSYSTTTPICSQRAAIDHVNMEVRPSLFSLKIQADFCSVRPADWAGLAPAGKRAV